MRKTVVMLLVVGLVLGLSSGIFAQEEKKATFGMKLLYLIPDLKEEILWYDEDEQELYLVETKGKPAIGFGMEYIAMDNPKSQLTIGLNYAKPKMEIKVDGIKIGSESYTWMQIPITYKAKFAKEGVVGGPYAGGGISWVRVSNGGSDDTVGFHLGAGYEFGKNMFAEVAYLSAEKDDVKLGGLSLAVGMKF